MKKSSSVINSLIIATIGFSGLLTGCGLENFAALKLNSPTKTEVQQKAKEEVKINAETNQQENLSVRKEDKSNVSIVNDKRVEQPVNRFVRNDEILHQPAPVVESRPIPVSDLKASPEIINRTAVKSDINPEKIGILPQYILYLQQEANNHSENYSENPVACPKTVNGPEIPSTLTVSEMLLLRTAVQESGFQGGFRIESLNSGNYVLNILGVEGNILISFNIESIGITLPNSILYKNFTFAESANFLENLRSEYVSEDAEDGQCWSRKGGVGYLLGNSVTKEQCLNLGGKSWCGVAGGCEDL
jgi:hypothetical protein